jgi:hypothetical protein
MIAFYRDPPPLDPELAAHDHFYWADHAFEDLIAAEERQARRMWAQIEEIHDVRHAA